jgi:hypothetical protein
MATPASSPPRCRTGAAAMEDGPARYRNPSHRLYDLLLCLVD